MIKLVKLTILAVLCMPQVLIAQQSGSHGSGSHGYRHGYPPIYPPVTPVNACKTEKRHLGTCYEYFDLNIENIERFWPRSGDMQKIEYSLPYKIIKSYSVQRYDAKGNMLPVEMQREEQTLVKKFSMLSSEGDEEDLYNEIRRFLNGSEFAFRCVNTTLGGGK